MGRMNSFAPYPAFGLGSFGLGGTALSGRTNILRPDHYMSPGQSLWSKNNRVRFLFQTDGLLVLFGDGRPLWGTGGAGATRLSNQLDGNLVVYSGNDRVGWSPMWASDTPIGPLDLIVLDDGNMALFHGNHTTVAWQTKTWGFQENWPSATTVFEDIVSVAGDVLAIAQVVISFVPVVGQGVNAAIAAGSALARGENITDAIASAAKNALPGGPLAAKAFDIAWSIGKSVVEGKPLDEAALAATRAALPDGAPKVAFDTALALANAQNIQQALVGVTQSLAPEAAKVTADLFNRPELLKLPVAEVAKLLNTNTTTVQTATAALNSNKMLKPPTTDKRPPPILKGAAATHPVQPNAQLVANLVAVARKYPKATDAEVVYLAVAAAPKLATNARVISQQLISNVIAVARKFPTAKDAEVLYVAAAPPPAPKAAPPPIVVASTKPAPFAPPAVVRRGVYAPYPKMV
jgi:hypothetical protein